MDRTKIAKLTKDNYESWKLEVEFLLMRDGLWKYVSPEMKLEPATEARSEARIGY